MGVIYSISSFYTRYVQVGFTASVDNMALLMALTLTSDISDAAK